jgi:superfamily II DNA/RNA helicase
MFSTYQLYKCTPMTDPNNKTPRKLSPEELAAQQRVSMNVVEVDGVHRTLPNVRHIAEETRGQDKLVVLNSILSRNSMKKYRTLIFCNTVNSSRAVEYALQADGIQSLSYHGDLNSRERSTNLEKFRAGEAQYMVCTDIAARGLDIPEIDHVIMFDFPLNPVDYIHR